MFHRGSLQGAGLSACWRQLFHHGTQLFIATGGAIDQRRGSTVELHCDRLPVLLDGNVLPMFHGGTFIGACVGHAEPVLVRRVNICLR